LSANALFRYVATHWRGEQSLSRSFLNGLIAYISPVMIFAGLRSLGANRSVEVAVFVVFLLGIVWSLVGIFRAGFTALPSWLKFYVRIGLMLGVIGLAAIMTWATARDLLRFGLI